MCSQLLAAIDIRPCSTICVAKSAYSTHYGLFNTAMRSVRAASVNGDLNTPDEGSGCGNGASKSIIADLIYGYIHVRTGLNGGVAMLTWSSMTL